MPHAPPPALVAVAVLGLAPTVDAQREMAPQAPCFVPNLGQWESDARFVHRSGPMTLFLEDSSWVVDLSESAEHGTVGRGAALRMAFVGAETPSLISEGELPGVHNYFLGDDESRWRTHVPLYRAVRYDEMYAGIDVRVRHAAGHPEYDLLLEPDTDLGRVVVRVDGAESIRVSDGALVIDTALGPLIQPPPKTWQRTAGGDLELACRYVVLGEDTFGFAVTGWAGDTELTIDPALLWSTQLDGGARGFAFDADVAQDGVTTIVGYTQSLSFPTTRGAYSRTAASTDGFVLQLDPSQVGAAQLRFGTYLGGSSVENMLAVSADSSGVMTVLGMSQSADFPTRNAYSHSKPGGNAGVIVRLDPSSTGSNQLAYSTFVGPVPTVPEGSITGFAHGDVVTFAATTTSAISTTPNAFDRTLSGSHDAYVVQLDLSRSGTAQLVYASYVGGGAIEEVNSFSADRHGVVTVSGVTTSTDLPTTPGAHDRSLDGIADGFVVQLDPSRAGASQLRFGTYVGGSGDDRAWAHAIDDAGAISVAARTDSTDLTMTARALRRAPESIYLAQYDSSRAGPGQLRYGSYFPGAVWGMVGGPDGVVTLVGNAHDNMPTTPNAFARVNSRASGFLTRIDLRRSIAEQLRYSTYLPDCWPVGVDVRVDGLTSVLGQTWEHRTFPLVREFRPYAVEQAPFVMQFDVGVSFHADVHELPAARAGRQTLTLDAGPGHAHRSYLILGSLSGAMPGFGFAALHVPLNHDSYTVHTLTIFGSTEFLTNGFGQLDANGSATAAFVVPSGLPRLPPLTLHHAYVVFDDSGFHLTSNPVPLRLH